MKTKESAGLINWSWLGLACLSLFVYGLADNSRGPVFPDLLKEFALSDSLGAWFFLLCSAGAVLNNVFMLRQMESWGAYRTLQIYTVVQALALLILGLSVRYELILAASVILGLSAGGLCVAQNALTAAAVTHHQRRQAFSALHCMYGFSSLMAPLLVMLFYRGGYAWRSVFTFLFFISVVVFAISIRRGRKDKTGDLPAKPVPREASEAARIFARIPRAVVSYYALLISLYCVAEVALSTRLVLFTRREREYNIDDANLLLAGFFLGLFIGRLFFALTRQTRLQSFSILRISCFFSLLSFSLGLVYHPFWLALCGLMMSVYYPCAIALIHEDVNGPGTLQTEQEAVFVTSWSVTSQCLALVFMHYLLGTLSDHFGLQHALWLGPVCLLIILTLLLFRPAVLRRLESRRSLCGGKA